MRHAALAAPLPRVLASAVAVAGCLACSRQGRVPKLSPGSELYALEQALVTEVDFRSSDRRTTIRKEPRSAAFAVVVADSAGRIVERCRAGPALDEVLKSLCQVRVVRQLSAEEAKQLGRGSAGPLAQLELHHRLPEGGSSESAGLEPLAYKILPRLAEAAPVALVDDWGAWEVDIPKRSISTLAGGCAALGSGTAPAR